MAGLYGHAPDCLPNDAITPGQMMRYHLRILMIVLVLSPTVFSWGWWEYRDYMVRRRIKELIRALPPNVHIGAVSGSITVSPNTGTTQIDWEAIDKTDEELRVLRGKRLRHYRPWASNTY